MSGSERTGTTLLAALGLVLGAIALWQPVGPIADSPGQRLVLAVPTWVQFVLLGATLVEFLAIEGRLVRQQRRSAARRGQRAAP
jgi:membrane protein implicated in regulation of membrane protease activity